MAKKLEKSGREELAAASQNPNDQARMTNVAESPNAEPTTDNRQQTTPPPGESITFSAPLGELPEGYISRHVEAQLSPQQARALRRIYEGCVDQGLRLANGRPVRHSADVIRYLLEQVDES